MTSTNSNIEVAHLFYYPNPITLESLCLGIFVRDLDTDERITYTTQNWKRFSSFAPDVSLDIFKDILTSIANEFKELHPLDFKKYTQTFVNNIRFDEVSEYKSVLPRYKMLDMEKMGWLPYD